MSNKYIKFVFFVIAILIIGFFFSSELVPIKDFFFNITSPFSKRIIGSTSGVTGFFESLKSIRSLSKENQELQKQNNELSAEIAGLNEIKHENDVLKGELGFIAGSNEKEMVPARVTSKSPSGYFQVIRVDKGKKDGVEAGKAVLSEGYLVGKVNDVGDNYSEITLITSNRLMVGMLLQESRGTGILQGGLKGLIAEYIPLDIEIKPGESVVTSGLSDEFPSGIAIGSVEEVISSESEIFQRIKVKSPVQFGKIEFVFILK